MRSVRRVGAFSSGFLLYSSVMGLSSVLAKVRLPVQVYALLGGRTSVLAVVLEAIVIALLMALVALVWAHLTVVPRGPLRRGHRPTTGWCVSGVAVAWLSWTIYGAINFSLNPKIYGQPLYALLLSSIVPPLWGVLNVLAVLAGVLLAGRWAKQTRDAALGEMRINARRRASIKAV